MIRLLIVFCLSVSVYAENALKDAISPYLRQHAENPIHWVEWSDEALTIAQKENKLIFLSIGYSSCHWCHVMEKEIFAEKDVASLLNQSFINIKVDKETRPDIDHVYMTALKLMKGEGGWPITAFLTPKADVVFIDSYLPKQKFLTLSGRLEKLWRAKPEILSSNATRLMRQVANHLSPKENTVTLTDHALNASARSLVEKLDLSNAGLKGLPKFPNEMIHLFLMDWAVLYDHKVIQAQILESLRYMAGSALFDPVEGGFHRYAVDDAFKIPHYEKMLYNQGLMLSLYARAYARQPEAAFSRVIERTVGFLLQDMSENALFFSAIDADSPTGEEGRYYQYTVQEKVSILGQHPFLSEGPLTLSELNQIGHNKDQELIAIEAFSGLRDSDLKPFVDRKSITAWNAMAIRGLIDAGVSMNRPKWIQLATNKMQLLLDTNTDSEGLKRFSYKGVLADEEATLEDYAWLISAMLGLYDATKRERWLNQAENQFSKMLAGFYDESMHGFRLFNLSGLPNNVLDMEDNNYPSASAMAILTAKQLLDRTGKLEYAKFAHVPVKLNDVIVSPEFYATLLQTKLGYGLVHQHYFAGGKGWIERVDNQLKFHLFEGWHINANQVNDNQLIPTQVIVASTGKIDYPKPILMKALYSESALPVFEGRFSIKLPQAKGHQDASVILQACSKDKCLAPETINFH